MPIVSIADGNTSPRSRTPSVKEFTTHIGHGRLSHSSRASGSSRGGHSNKAPAYDPRTSATIPGGNTHGIRQRQGDQRNIGDKGSGSKRNAVSEGTEQPTTKRQKATAQPESGDGVHHVMLSNYAFYDAINYCRSTKGQAKPAFPKHMSLERQEAVTAMLKKPEFYAAWDYYDDKTAKETELRAEARETAKATRGGP